MPVQTWTPGQTLTAAELRSVTNLLPYTETVSGAETLAAGNYYIANTSGGGFTLTLPETSSVGVALIGVGLGSAVSGVLKIKPESDDSIIGYTNDDGDVQLWNTGDSVMFLSDGNNWHIISINVYPAVTENSPGQHVVGPSGNATPADLTAPADGMYVVRVKALVTSATTTGIYSGTITLKQNSTVVDEIDFNWIVTSTLVGWADRLLMAEPVAAAVGDTFTVEFFNSSASAGDLTFWSTAGGSTDNAFDLTYIRPGPA